MLLQLLCSVCSSPACHIPCLWRRQSSCGCLCLCLWLSHCLGRRRCPHNQQLGILFAVPLCAFRLNCIKPSPRCTARNFRCLLGITRYYNPLKIMIILKISIQQNYILLGNKFSWTYKYTPVFKYIVCLLLHT